MEVRRMLATALVTLTAFASSSVAADEETPEPSVIGAGSRVSIEYTLTLEDGNVADTNVGGEPLVYQQGSGQILPALEQALVGMPVGGTKQVDLSAEEGYGPVDDALYNTVEAAQIPEEARTVGAVLIAQAANGQKRPVRVHEVKGEEIVLDLNHPLAGKALHFAIRILSIE